MMTNSEDTRNAIELSTYTEYPDINTQVLGYGSKSRSVVLSSIENKSYMESTVCHKQLEILHVVSSDPKCDTLTKYQGLLYESINYPPLNSDAINFSSENMYEDIPASFFSAVPGNNPDAENVAYTVEHGRRQTRNIGAVLQEDSSLHIIRKLSRAKEVLSFSGYFAFTIKAVRREVEALTFLDIFYMLSGICTLPFGIRDSYKCSLSQFLPFLVICYGILAVLTSIAFIRSTFLRDGKECGDCFMTLHRIARAFMLSICLLGLYEVFVHFPPTEDTGSPNYCSPFLYWSALFIFLTVIGIAVLTGLHVIIFTAWFFI